MKQGKNLNRKFHVKVNDEVLVIAGNSKGSKGKIAKILTEKERVIVEGVNMVTKHVKPSAERPEGGIVKKEASIHISNVKLIDPKTGDAVRTYREKVGKTTKRFSKKTKEIID